MPSATSDQVEVAQPVAANDKPTKPNQSEIDFMREHFSKQRRIQIRVPKDAGEQWVQINGYTFQIKEGERVSVPEQVAEVLQNAGVI